MVRASAKTQVKGKERVDRLKAILRGFSEAYVTIGIHESAGKYTKGANPPMVVQVALWNEFGTETSPSRSFVRTAIDENEAMISRWREEMITNIIEKGWTVQRALEAMGFRIQILIQNKIKSNVPPPNEPGTIAHKKREGLAPVTLIESGLMLRSVTYKVVLK